MLTLTALRCFIDGEYIESRNNGSILRGSDNQTIHILDKKYEENYLSFLSRSRNQIQNFMTSDGVDIRRYPQTKFH